MADATASMKKEAADFTAMEKELADKIDTLERVIRVLEQEMARNPAAFARADMCWSRKWQGILRHSHV